MSVADDVGKIRILPEDVISRIAAGEVIERPAAVVKELLDNSLDAGSTRITIDVQDGGRTLIRVSDDGEGMSAADAPLAFQRHATSKLRSEQDLQSLRTLGFRGEALPSIASVAKVRLVTSSRHEPAGTRVIITGGTLATCEETAAAPGTQIDVEDLFFNTPARKKFLKTTTTEFTHICQIVQHAGLAWPGTQFRLKHNGQSVLEYPAVSSRRDRILQVHGARFAEQSVAVQGGRPGIRVEGFAVRPTQARTGRTPQELIINGRAVKNAAVSRAVYDAYGTFLAKGCHPTFVLFLDVDPERVDVNVHPTKREVRFADQDLIYQAVRYAVRDAVSPADPAMHAATISGMPPRSGITVSSRGSSSVAASFAGRGPSASLPEHAGVVQADLPSIQESVQTYLAGDNQSVLPLGQIGRTYLIAQIGSELHVIDQHTAHERVLFERLSRARLGREVPSQPLLIPEPVEVPPHGALLLERHLKDLEQIGLTVEPFGSHTFVIRAVPALLRPFDYAALVLDLVEELSQWNTASPLETRLCAVMASLACHGAVRAGREMEGPEIKQLIDDWIEEGQPVTCPHGRRVDFRLTEQELAKIFGR